MTKPEPFNFYFGDRLTLHVLNIVAHSVALYSIFWRVGGGGINMPPDPSHSCYPMMMMRQMVLYISCNIWSSPGLGRSHFHP